MRTLILVLALLAAACTSEPTIQKGPDAEILGGNLHRVDNSRAGLAYVDPDVDFSRYTRLMIDPLGVDNVEIIQPQGGGVTRPRSGDWELTQRDKDDLRRIFAEVMQNNLQEKGDYPIVSEPGDDVLRITAALTALEPSAAADDPRSRGVGRARVYTEGAGTTHIKVVFTDSETGEVLALVEDSKTSQDLWGVNNRVTNLSDVRRHFNSWARAIRARLDIINGH
jgi:hypothetical protein